MADPLADKINEAFEQHEQQVSEQVHKEMDLAEFEAELELGSLDFTSLDLDDYDGV